jgi:hypothetical protein
MSVIEKSEELRQQAIELLLTEREAIEQQLQTLGHGQEKTAPSKRRGRPPNLKPQEGVPEPPSSHSEMTA